MSLALEMDRMLTRREAAELLKMRPQTLAKWSLDGRHLPVVRVGARSVRYKLSDVQKLIDRGTQPAAK